MPGRVDTSEDRLRLPTADTRARVTGPVPSEVDIVIIGAGMGGLTAGAYLAQNGMRVAVFDAHYVAGGCCTQFARGSGADRYQFDVGLHYIGDCGPEGDIPRLLQGVGIDQDFLPMDQDGFDTLVFPDFEFKIPANRELYRERLIEYFPKEKRGIDRYIRLCREVDRLAKHAGGGRPTLRLAVEATLRGRLAALNQGATIGAFLDTCTQDERLRAVFLGQNGDYGLPPSKVSAMLHCGLANHYFKGAYYPRGGGQILADRLADTIEAAGGSIHLRRPVSKITVNEEGRATGVRFSTQRGATHEVRAKVVLSNADLKQTMLELVPQKHVDPEVRQKVQNYEMGGAIFLTCLGVNADMAAKGMRACNYWQFDGYDMEAFYDTIHDDRIVPKGCYITSATLKDPHTHGHSPEGVTNIEVMTLVPGRAEAWGVTTEEARKPQYRKSAAYLERKAEVEADMVRRLEALFPGTADTIVFKESATPVTHTRFTWAADGSGYGIACTPEQFLGNRPNYYGPVDGMFLCGASTRAGHGVLGSMSSGLAAAKRVARSMGKPLPVDEKR